MGYYNLRKWDVVPVNLPVQTVTLTGEDGRPLTVTGTEQHGDRPDELMRMHEVKQGLWASVIREQSELMAQRAQQETLIAQRQAEEKERKEQARERRRKITPFPSELNVELYSRAEKVREFLAQVDTVLEGSERLRELKTDIEEILDSGAEVETKDLRSIVKMYGQ
jgi:hypothetical protein